MPRRVLHRLRQAARRLQTRRTNRDLHRTRSIGPQKPGANITIDLSKGVPKDLVHLESTQLADAALRANRQRLPGLRARRVSAQRRGRAGADTRDARLSVRSGAFGAYERRLCIALLAVLSLRRLRGGRKPGQSALRQDARERAEERARRRAHLSMTARIRRTPTEILDVLRAEHVHATFFVVGRAVQAYPHARAPRSRSAGTRSAITRGATATSCSTTKTGLRRTLQRTDRAIFAATGAAHADHAPALRFARLARAGRGAQARLHAGDVVGPARKRLGVSACRASSRRACCATSGDGAIITLHDGNRGIVCARACFARVCAIAVRTSRRRA